MQENPGNSNSEGKRKTVRVSGNSSYRGKFQGQEILIAFARSSSYPSSSYRGSTVLTQNCWDKQGVLWDKASF